MKTAFLFAGQGQQFLNMGQDLADKHPQVKEMYQKAEAILGYDLLHLDESKLHETQYTQPALLTLNCAIALLLKGVSKDYVAGLSLGEYAALTESSVLSFEDALKLVAQRALIMNSAFSPNETGMVAVLKCDYETLSTLLKGTGVEICNYNTPDQIVIGGRSEDLDKTVAMLKENGVRRCIPLKVSSVSHMSLLTDASQELETVLKQFTFKKPSITFINNVDARVQESGFEDTLKRQISQMTRLSETIQYLIDQGVQRFIEIGPKGALSKCVLAHDKSLSVVNIYDDETLVEFLGGYNA